MTTQTVHIQTYDYGASLSSATLRVVSTDVLVATADTVNEVTADSGLYAAVFGEVLVIAAGEYRLRAIVSGKPINRYVTLAGTDGEIVQARNERLAVLDSAAILAVADQVWDEATSGHTTAGTYGGRIVRATNTNVEVQITGSNHIAADVHEFQTGVITAGDFAANSITASALATDAVTEIQSGLATATALAAAKTILDKVDTGLVVDGAVYQFTTNMLELGPSGGGGSGTGARTVTITINDGTTALQNATVRMTEGANTYTALTNVSGVAVFNLDDATYTVGVTKAGYTYAGTTLIVNGTESATYSMTVTTITPPSNPSLSAIVVLCLDAAGQPEAGVAVDIRIITVPSGSQNIAYKGAKQTATSNVNGVARFEVVQGSVCEWKRGKADVWSSVTIDSDSVTNVTSVIGSP